MTNTIKITKTNLTNKTKQYLGIAAILAASIAVPEISFAADNVDAFASIYSKINGWVGGTAGKLVTFICFAMAGIMGVAGFPTKYILGAMGTGLLLSSSGSLVNMLFA